MANVPHEFHVGIEVAGTANVNGDEVLTSTENQLVQNKNIDSTNNIDAGALPSAIDAANIADGSVSNAEFQYLDGVTSDIQTQLDAKIDDSEKGANNGVATLDAGGKIPVAQLPSSVMTYEGTWNASTNTPTLADGIGDAGMVYLVSVTGTQDLGSGSQTFNAGDWVVYSGTIWEKSENTSSVVSVNGQMGVVVLDSDDIAEGVTNLYATDERAQDAVGNILTDSSKIDFTYDDITPAITATIVPLSITDGDINASAAITATKIADGSVTNAEFQFINSLTSNAQTQLDAKASTTLNNLGTTALNANLLPSAAGLRNIGTTTLPFAEVDARLIQAVLSGASGLVFSGLNNALTKQLVLAIDSTLPSGVTGEAVMRGGVSPMNVAVYTISSATNNAVATSDVRIETGNKTNGTGNSGAIVLQTGTSVGGTRGGITLNAPANGSVLVNQPTGATALAIATTQYVDNKHSTGDIFQTSFSAANNQASPADVTGFAFANGSVRSFEALVSVSIDATADLFEVFTIRGVQKGVLWDIAVSSNGDDSGVDFSITTAGQIQYTSGNQAGFVTGTIKFRAIVTNV